MKKYDENERKYTKKDVIDMLWEQGLCYGLMSYFYAEKIIDDELREKVIDLRNHMERFRKYLNDLEEKGDDF